MARFREASGSGVDDDRRTQKAGAGTDPRDAPIPLLAQFSYGFGSVSTAVKNAAFAYLLLYYNQVVGIPATIVSTAIAATLFVDALVDPLIGRWSDVTRSRIGRRHPFILGSAIPTAVFFLLIWLPPEGLSPLQTGLWIFAVASITRVAVSAYDVPSTAMVPELTTDYGGRTRLFSLRFWFGYVGTFIFVALSLTLFFVATPEHPVGQLNPDGYVKFAIAGAVVMAVAIFVCGFGTLGQVPRMQQAEDNGRPGGGWMFHVRETFVAFRHRGFLAIFGFGVLKFTAIGLATATALYFNTYVFDLSAKQIAVLALEAVTAATLAAPLAPKFSRRLGKKRTAMLMAFGGIVITLSPLVLTYFDLFLRPGDPFLVPALLLVGTFGGGMIAISLINTSSMLADVVDDYAVRTGRHASGVFFSASSFMQQCSAALGVFVAGLVLSASGFPEKAEPSQISRAAELSLIAHYVPTVLALWLVGVLILLFYDIDQVRHRSNVDRLRALAAEKRAREKENLGLDPATR
ncbi:MFS transporter [Erythrobacter sp. LQ02-29]|uniref:MFS transporter n=1 Tax=Erythrobacter sp. LQ02-29 TaxID=2920384 RepID=UPI001F4E9963|nr:MFS transporter [Erythrobacter sp. LQ02-29]MCP9221164.1 MFS transporter [Erythrobacter sp. LQ02-29]